MTEDYSFDQIEAVSTASQASKKSKKRKKEDTEPSTESLERKEARRLRKEKKRRKVGECLEQQEVLNAQPLSFPEIDKSKQEPQNIEQKPKFGVWIGNLAYSTTIKSLSAYLSSNQSEPSAIQKIKMPHQLITPQLKTRIIDQSIVKRGQVNKGFAIVYFETQTGAQDALKLSETELEGRKLLIKLQDDYQDTGAIPRPSKSTKTSSKAQQQNMQQVVVEPNTKLFVGNLSFDTTKDQVKKWFTAYGDLINIRLAQFEDSGKCRGFAYIIYRYIDGARACIEAAGADGMLQVEDGFTVRVEYGSKPDTKRANGTVKDSASRFMARQRPHNNYAGETNEPDPCAIPRQVMNTKLKFD